MGAFAHVVRKYPQSKYVLGGSVTAGYDLKGHTIAALNWAISERESEIARLHELVAGYERGRFVRLMK